jgi:hypothetical protein
MLAQTNWTGKDEFHRSERRAYWVYNEVSFRTEKKLGIRPVS